MAQRSDHPLLFANIITGCKIKYTEVDSWLEHIEEGDEPTKYIEVYFQTNQGFGLKYTGGYSYVRDNFLSRYRRDEHSKTPRVVEAKLSISKRKSPISVDGLVQLSRFTDESIFRNFDFSQMTKRNIIRWNRELLADLGIDCDEPEFIFTLDSLAKLKNKDLAQMKTTKHEINWVGGQELLNKSVNALLRSLGKLEQV